VFTAKGSEVTSNWPDKIYKEWLPHSAYEEAHKVTLEYHGLNFKGMDDAESEWEIHVPVGPRAIWASVSLGLNSGTAGVHPRHLCHRAMQE
jgi:hypothetical protein